MKTGDFVMSSREIVRLQSSAVLDGEPGRRILVPQGSIGRITNIACGAHTVSYRGAWLGDPGAPMDCVTQVVCSADDIEPLDVVVYYTDAPVDYDWSQVLESEEDVFVWCGKSCRKVYIRNGRGMVEMQVGRYYSGMHIVISEEEWEKGKQIAASSAAGGDVMTGIPTSSERAKRALRIVETYMEETGLTSEDGAGTALVDLLADLMHLSDMLTDEGFDAAVDSARNHHDAECQFTCNDCGDQMGEESLKPVKHYDERVDKDDDGHVENEPDGQCPQCGALCYKTAALGGE